jgi:hypothetical protein
VEIISKNRKKSKKMEINYKNNLKIVKNRKMEIFFKWLKNLGK